MSDAATIDAEGIALKREHPARATIKRLLRHRLFMTGLVLFLIIAITAILAPWITDVDPNRLSMRNKFKPPSEGWVFGTDSFGRSLWSRVVWGAQLSMLIGASVVALNAVFGILIGAAAGYFRRIDNLLMRINDALMAFPAILLAIAVTSVLGPSTFNVILALGIVYIPRTARIVRASVLVVREMEFVQAARAAGAGDWRIISRHIMPNCMAPLIVQLSFIFAYAVLSEAVLSFLGLGAPPSIPSWGTMISEGRTYIREAAWLTVVPGCAIAITVLGLNLMGDGLRDVLDPRLKVEQG